MKLINACFKRLIPIETLYYCGCSVVLVSFLLVSGCATSPAQKQMLGADSVEAVSAASSLSAGLLHTCALLEDGTISCWGSNVAGQLGNGSSVSSASGVQVVGIDNAIQVSAGAGQTCALLSDNTVKCWGENSSGELGNGSTESSLVPVMVTGLNDIKDISSGFSHTCALDHKGTVKCWGNNEVGQLGNGTKNNQLTPIDVTDIGESIAISSGIAHTCALLKNNTISCWGTDSFGRNDITYSLRSLIPVVVPNISYAKSVTTGRNHTCILALGDYVKCWGSNIMSQLGNYNAGAYTQVPSLVSELNDVTSVSAGAFHTCALVEDGTVKCWGLELRNELSGDLTEKLTTMFEAHPAQVEGLSNVQSIDSGGSHTCALLEDQTVKCWGDNEFGQLGRNEK